MNLEACGGQSQRSAAVHVFLQREKGASLAFFGKLWYSTGSFAGVFGYRAKNRRGWNGSA